MIPEKLREILEKNQYRIIGGHSALQICPWTKKSLRGEGVCWKEKFYGIKSSGCCQMSPAVMWCENSCLHCWRPIEYTLGTKLKRIDSPKKIIEEVVRERKKLLMGFKGSKKTDKKKFREALEPSLFTFSLSGEPTLYPKLAELIKEIRKRNAVSFLVTNGLNPEKIKELGRKNALPTQLTVSINAPNETLYETICRSSKKDSWKKLNQTLDLMKRIECRTIARLTLIKELNMEENHAEQYAKLIKKASPLFVHIKGWVCRGFSKNRLSFKKMPRHKEVKEFSEKILKFLPDFKFLDDKFESNVVLLGKDKSRMKIQKNEI